MLSFALYPIGTEFSVRKISAANDTLILLFFFHFHGIMTAELENRI